MGVGVLASRKEIMALSSDGADFGNLGIPQSHLRDVDADELKAINVTIASYLDVGQQPTAHILMLRREKEAKMSRERGIVFEHAAEDALPETAVPRRPERARRPEPEPGPPEHKAEPTAPEAVEPRKPGRPRKPSNDDVPGGS